MTDPDALAIYEAWRNSWRPRCFKILILSVALLALSFWAMGIRHGKEFLFPLRSLSRNLIGLVAQIAIYFAGITGGGLLLEWAINRFGDKPDNLE